MTFYFIFFRRQEKDSKKKKNIKNNTDNTPLMCVTRVSSNKKVASIIKAGNLKINRPRYTNINN